MNPRNTYHEPPAIDVNGRGMGQSRDNRGVGDLIKELRNEATTLMRQEVALAKTELSEKAAKAGRNGAYLGVGALVSYAGLIFLLLAATHGIGLMLTAAGLPEEHAWWVAPLIVGAVVAGIGYLLIQKAMSAFSRPEDFVPQKTMDTLQENTQWAKQKVT